MKKHLSSRLLSLLLALSLLASFAVPVRAAGLSWNAVDTAVSADLADCLVQGEAQETVHRDTDLVRVSIVLEEKPTVQAGYSTMDIARNDGAMAYRESLQARQQAVAQSISAQALGGQALDVVWNLTLVGNIISANVPYGKLEAISQVEGVRSVSLERQYAPAEASRGDEGAQPQMYTSAGMIGSDAAWLEGYTGAGTRIAVIDTGTDTDHQSFQAEAFHHALEENAKEAGMSYADYAAKLDLLDEEEIDSLLEKLHIHEKSPQLTGKDLYLNEKLALGYNYVDSSLEITHDHDAQGEHGSHVAGISTANRFLKQGDGFVSAAEAVNVCGVAPDAQLLTMKVFGQKGGAYESDYMVAIEDAIMLGADAVNLSLGSAAPGEAANETYAKLLDSLQDTDTVVVISAGNSGSWADGTTTNGFLYNDGVSMDTVGSPGSYTNSLAVASVENRGSTGKYFAVGELPVVYTETTGYNNLPMASLDTSAGQTGTVIPYVLVDGFGTAEDYQGVDLKGKVVFCSRGSTSFFEKANVAASLGAAATVVYNNTAGSINMDLSGYNYTAPCVSILQSEGAAIKAASTAAETEAGTTYYTGEMTVYGKSGVSIHPSAYYTMSDFSSWGVPGDLSLKPEITAPGGNIYSVNGLAPGGTAYEVMSGTSMAAPQVAGLSALAAQYIRENGLAEKTGCSVRTLAQSLLMSTAQPLYEEASGGNYYSVLKQGAGLARVDRLMEAESYVLVEGQPDGKVKAELGDDPDRTGVYRFAFTIHNLTDQPLDYALSADLFTQDVFADGNTLYMDTWTTALAANTSFTADGVPIVQGEALTAFDLNGDGQVNEADANTLLEYLLGNVEELHTTGDVNGDGKVNTYDAHVLLALLEGKSCVTVPAAGQVQVEVTMTLPQAVKEYLDTASPKGAYVEGYVYAAPVATEEGEQGVTHSIPVLGFYGNWTEPSMYDVSSPLELKYGTDTRMPYLQAYHNSLLVTYGGESQEYYFGGNPVVQDETYLTARNAFNNQNGDTISRLVYAQIRNAGSGKFTIRNLETGEVYEERLLDANSLEGAYFSVNEEKWYNTQRSIRVKWNGQDAQGNPLPEGTRVELSLALAPEYYRNADGTYAWEKLGQGAYITQELTIDNTAPKVSDISLSLLEGRELKVTASDNEYVAAIALMSPSGSKVYRAVAGNQTERGAQMEALVSLEGLPSRFLVAVYDYAMNVSTYGVELGDQQDDSRPYFTAINRTNLDDAYRLSWVGFGMEESTETVNLGHIEAEIPRAAEYVDGYVFLISNDNGLYVASDEDLSDVRRLSTLTCGDLSLANVVDIAYSKADGQLYGLFYADDNGKATPYLCTIDMFLGTTTLVGEMSVDAVNLAIDGKGNFYSTLYNGNTLYTYTAQTYRTPSVVGTTGSYACKVVNCMAWDHNTDKLYWGYTANNMTYLLDVNVETAEPTLVRTLPFSSTGLYVRPQEDSSRFAPTDEVAMVELDRTQLRTLPDNTVQLTATVWPWTVSSGDVTWISEDPSIATVNPRGQVTGVAEGTTTITATSVLDATKFASCTVEVTKLDRELNATVWDQDGKVWWSSFNTGSLPQYTKLTETPANEPLAAVTYGGNGKLYAASLDTSSLTSNLYTVDPETFETTLVGGTSDIGYVDLTAAPGCGYLLAVYGPYIVLVDPATGGWIGYFDWSSGLQDNKLVGIAYYATQYDTDYQAFMDMFFVVDDMGNIYFDAIMPYNGGFVYFQGPDVGLVGNFGRETDTPYFNSLYFDGAYLYWSQFSQEADRVDLLVWDAEDSELVYQLGSFQDSVWPVGGLFSRNTMPGYGWSSANGREVSKEFAGRASTEPMKTLRQPVAAGGLQAAQATAEKPARTNQTTHTGIYDPDTHTVTVTLKASEAVASGRVAVSYDTTKLTLTSVTGLTQAFASHHGNGTVELAYAAAHPVDPYSTLALLTFQCTEAAVDGTELTVTSTERDGQAVEDTAVIPVELPHTCYAKDFLDVDLGRWYHEPIDFVVSQGLMKGMGENRFQPNTSMTRGQLVTVLYRLAGEPAIEGTSPFADVQADRFYADAIAWAYGNEIAKGVTDDRFMPNSPVTREQMVTFLARFARWSGLELQTGGSLEDYADAGSVSAYAEEAMTWAVENGIIQGMTETTLVPKGTATRAQVATILMRYCQKFA